MQQELDYRVNSEQRERLHVNILFVFDDVIGDIKANESNSRQTKLILNRRHLVHNGTISLCIVTQKYTLIPSRLRSNANWLILFKLNPIDFDNVYSDSITLSKQNWRELLEIVFGKNLDAIDSDSSAGEDEKEEKEEKKEEEKDKGSRRKAKEERKQLTGQVQEVLARSKRRHDMLGVWIESNTFFKNFRRVTAKKQHR
ncbi:hypothetical protein KDA23_05550 [Candidatus Saccharibacteria bacterium]|nr:hypothetical protein [Candidatus Saccharibacteria bacterium]